MFFNFFFMSTLSLTSYKELTANHGVFSSPNYPEQYGHEANCTWTIIAPENHTIHLKFDPFDVKSSYRKCQLDYVKIIYYGGQEDDVFCTEGSRSHLPPDLIKSTTNTLTVNLISDDFYFNGKGFQATYYVVDKFGNKVEAEENEDIFDPDWNDNSTGLADKKTGTEIEKDTADEKSMTHEDKVTQPAEGKGIKEKEKKCRCKKNWENKEERRRLRRLQKQKKRALKREERRARRREKISRRKN